MVELVKYFRIVDSDIAHNKPIVQELFLVKKTPKGAWIVHGWTRSQFLQACEKEEPISPDMLREWGARIVYDEARRKYAYPTLELALDSYVIRKRRQMQHARNALESAEENLGWALRAEVQSEFTEFAEPVQPSRPHERLF